MTSKERVHAALSRQPVDRLPVWMWYHPDTSKRLANILEIPAEQVAYALGDDIRQAWVSNNHPMEGIVHEHDGEGHTDPWGIQWVKDGPFNQIRNSPLQNVDDDTAKAYPYPYTQMDELLANMNRIMPYRQEYFIGCDISPSVFEMVTRVRGMEQAVMDLAAAPVLSRHMLAKAAEFTLELGRQACERFPLDWLWSGDDVGGQSNMIMSPQTWRDLVKPHLAEIFDISKSRGMWTAYHSCGSIRPIIPDLIDMGLDVLNPIQCNCPGMDPFELKKEYGKKLAFMGGVDTQELLPLGTADEVYRATIKLVEEMTRDGGGYILAASHAVPPETPTENIWAMYKAAGISKEEIFDRAATGRNR